MPPNTQLWTNTFRYAVFISLSTAFLISLHPLISSALIIKSCSNNGQCTSLHFTLAWVDSVQSLSLHNLPVVPEKQQMALLRRQEFTSRISHYISQWHVYHSDMFAFAFPRWKVIYLAQHSNVVSRLSSFCRHLCVILPAAVVSVPRGAEWKDHQLGRHHRVHSTLLWRTKTDQNPL